MLLLHLLFLICILANTKEIPIRVKLTSSLPFPRNPRMLTDDWTAIDAALIRNNLYDFMTCAWLFGPQFQRGANGNLVDVDATSSRI